MRYAFPAAATLLLMGATCDQNTARKIDRANTTTTYRVVAYGDSIFAGYYGSTTAVAKRAAPYVLGEYLAQRWNADIEVIRRTKSGATADDIYANKIIAERSHMQVPQTRAVVLDMCGNDYLQARTAFNASTCDVTPLDRALSNCITYVERALGAVNTYATTATIKQIMNLYYPGFTEDNVATNCRDAATGAALSKRDLFLRYLATSNYRTCDLAQRYGFTCIDAFANYMAADYDRGGPGGATSPDGVIDSDALRFNPAEAEAAYVQRITVTLKPTLVDSNTHLATPAAAFDYLLSDDTHPTYHGSTIGSSSGSPSITSGAPDFTDSQIVGGKNPMWNQRGQERLGWAHSAQ